MSDEKVLLTGLPRYRASLLPGGNTKCDYCETKARVFAAMGQWCTKCSPIAIYDYQPQPGFYAAPRTPETR